MGEGGCRLWPGQGQEQEAGQVCTQVRKPVCQCTAHKTSLSIPLALSSLALGLTTGPYTSFLGLDAYPSGVSHTTSATLQPLTGILHGLGAVLRDPAGTKAPTTHKNRKYAGHHIAQPPDLAFLASSPTSYGPEPSRGTPESWRLFPLHFERFLQVPHPSPPLPTPPLSPTPLSCPVPLPNTQAHKPLCVNENSGITANGLFIWTGPTRVATCQDLPPCPPSSPSHAHS